jgi:hypothetical protein
VDGLRAAKPEDRKRKDADLGLPVSGSTNYGTTPQSAAKGDGTVFGIPTRGRIPTAMHSVVGDGLSFYPATGHSSRWRGQRYPRRYERGIL